MPQRSKPARRQRDPLLDQKDPAEMLEVLFALDRMLVEVSMRLYKVPRRDRFTLRAGNQRLHDVVRQHLPRLLTPDRTQL